MMLDYVQPQKWVDVPFPDWQMVAMALKYGCERAVNAAAKRYARNYGSPANLCLNEACMGCVGELAVALHFDIEWKPLWTKGDPWPMSDVGPLEVRTVYQPGRRLIVHGAEKDHDQTRVVLADASEVFLQRAPVVRLRGWIIAKHARACGRWEEHRPGGRCCFVDDEALVEMATLKI